MFLAKNEFLERVRRLHHRGDDVFNSELFAFQQVANGLAAANFEGDLKVGPASHIDQAQHFIGSRAFGFEFGLYRNRAKFVPEGFENVQHFSFALIHFSPIQSDLIPSPLAVLTFARSVAVRRPNRFVAFKDRNRLHDFVRVGVCPVQNGVMK